MVKGRALLKVLSRPDDDTRIAVLAGRERIKVATTLPALSRQSTCETGFSITPTSSGPVKYPTLIVIDVVSGQMTEGLSLLSMTDARALERARP